LVTYSNFLERLFKPDDDDVPIDPITGEKFISWNPKYKDELDQVELPFHPSLLQNAFIAGKELRRCYKATRDGFSAEEFHARVDNRGPTVVVATAVDPTDAKQELTVGGYNPKGWLSTEDYLETQSAFLFVIKGKGEGQFSISKKIGGLGAALHDFSHTGPIWADGLVIGPPTDLFAAAQKKWSTLDTAKSRLGLSYEKLEDGCDSLFGADPSTTIELVEVEAFCCPELNYA